ncbi:MAG: 2-isopropylmalate synthase [Desulfovibrionaceae bacterium]
MDRVQIFDTTLRDGEQAVGAAMLPAQKLEIARQLERLGVDVMEVGFPAASPHDFKAVEMVCEAIRETRIAVFCRSVESDIVQAAESTRKANGSRIVVSTPVSDIHMRHKLGKSREEVLEIIHRSVARAAELCDDPAWIGIDTMRADEDYLCKAVEAAVSAGARSVALADTVGYAVPADVQRRVRRVLQSVPGMDKVTLSIHAHDDLGLATANSLAAVEAGAREVQCTINGLGERAGNAPLEEVVMALTVRRDSYGLELGINTTELLNASRLVSGYSGFVVPPNKPLVGSNAFAHGSGIHQDALVKWAETYQIMDPQSVGAASHILTIGPHSGRRGLSHKLQCLGISLNDVDLAALMERIKQIGPCKKTFSDDEIRSLVQDVASGEPKN